MRTSGTALVAAVSLVVAGCGTPSADAPDGASGTGGTGTSAPVAVSTTTPLGSVVQDVVTCNGGTASTLMAPGDDPHTFAPSSAQLAQLTQAELVVAIGLGLEEGLGAAIENARSDGARVLELAPLLDPLPFDGTTGPAEDDHEGEEDEHADDDGHAHDGDDPHVWLDASRMATAAELVGEDLATVTGDDGYAGCGTQVAAELRDVHEQVVEILAAVPEERRVLVTDHQSFGYFAQAYDFDLLGVVVPGGSTDAEPSSQELAELVEVVRDAGVPAVFSNTAVSSSLVEAVAAEAGGEVQVVELYVGSVGPEGSGATTYADLMLTDARLIADALG
ncbi:metal ABC transporter substrate-binding protein [uncultured Ornithinimicrobium sp.]|uniref:metal ABC transporter substrate-binding protein n=1 Tax=uncultured Ornithinimicrobium sp. TaxID=259307 RepID=UPI002598D051|nr:metal ABC transporter substrate-binding protein [uncultured Ornithinimicrobium sp.]